MRSELKQVELLTIYQLSTPSMMVVALYQLFGRRPIDYDKFADHVATSPIFEYDRRSYACREEPMPSLCLAVGWGVDLILAQWYVRDNRLSDYIIEKIERLLERGVPITRDLAEIAKYQIREYEAVALLTFTMFGLEPVNLGLLEEEAVQRLGLSRLTARSGAEAVTREIGGKHYLHEIYVEEILTLRKRIDALLGSKDRPDRKMQLALAIYELYGEKWFYPEELFGRVGSLYRYDKVEFSLDLAELTRRDYDALSLKYNYVIEVRKYLENRKAAKRRARRVFS